MSEPIQRRARSLLADTLDRRNFIKRSALVGVSIPALSLLAACGGEDADDPTAVQPAAQSSPTPGSGGVTVQQNVTPTATSESAPDATSTPEPAAATEVPAGQSGGSITVTRQVDSENLDPVIQDGNINIWVFMSIYDQLIGVDDNGRDLVPRLAESWEIEDDGATYVFNIRQGVKFFDGSDMTVEDIKWSIERARDTEESPWTFSLAQVQEVATPDDSTVVISLPEPWAPFLPQVAMFNASVISKNFADEAGVGALVDQTMGTGPFHLSEWRKGERMTLVKNPYYWEDGLPLLDEIIWTVVPDGNSQILQLQGGDVDGIIGQSDVPFNRVPDLERDANLEVFKWTSTYNNFIPLNTRNAPLDDVNVRQALNYATDKQALIDTILFGNGEISNSFMPNGALYWNPDQEGYPFDLERAEELMAESNHPDGFTLEFMVRSGNQQQLQIATALMDMWSRIGIELDIQQLDSAVVSDRYRAFDFEAILSGWTNDIIDPDQLVSYAILPETIQNYRTGWVNQEAVDLANEGRTTLDPDDRREIYHEIQRIHMEDAPFVYLYVLPYVDVMNTRVDGYFHHPMGHYNFKRTTVED
jgi:peptide/nickel transport system substrate-binding protein